VVDFVELGKLSN